MQDSTKVLLALLMPMSILEPIVADRGDGQPPSGGATALPRPAMLFVVLCCTIVCQPLLLACSAPTSLQCRYASGSPQSRDPTALAGGREDPSEAVANARERLRSQLQRALDAIPAEQLEQVGAARVNS